MRCGTDADGGANRQRGCGKQFMWSQAKPYEADLRNAAADDYGTNAEGEAGRDRRMRRDAGEMHELMPGTPLPCDGCGEQLVGPRWQCIHCEGGVDLCIGCVGKVAQGKAIELRDGRRHPKGHVFRRVRPGLTSVAAAAALDVEDEAAVVAAGAASALRELASPRSSANVVGAAGRGSSRKRPISLDADADSTTSKARQNVIDLDSDDSDVEQYVQPHPHVNPLAGPSHQSGAASSSAAVASSSIDLTVD
jgi:hypothetical protein